MKTCFSPILAALILGVACLPASASNWQWLHNSGLGTLSDDDWQTFSNALQDALETAQDGETRHWKNPATGKEGRIRIIESGEPSSLPCRQVQLESAANKDTGSNPLTFCKEPGKPWRIHNDTPPR